jgi:hypothetical protein
MKFQAVIEEAVPRGHKLDTFSVALSADAQRRFGGQWKEHLESRYREGVFASEEVATLMLGWPDKQSTWQFAASLGPEVDASFWHRKPVWPLAADASAEEVESIVRKYLDSHRPDAAVHTVQPAADGVSGELVLETPDNALAELDSPGSTANQNLLLEVQEIFRKLSRRDDIPLLEIGKREYA